MKKSDKIFVDSDVIVSSLISQQGAAHLLINKSNLNLYISNFSYKELKIVCRRLKLNGYHLERLIKNNFIFIKLKQTIKKIKSKYGKYTTDKNDSHIVAGAVKAKARFIISYNIKHFKTNLIKKDFKQIEKIQKEIAKARRSL